MNNTTAYQKQSQTILMHRRTAMHIERLLRQKPHAILLNGADGCGKKYIAQYIAAKLLDVPDPTKTPRYYVITPNDKGIIPIEDVRRIREITSLKETTSHEVARVVCLFDVHTMVDSAHHALLKLLEEPPAGTIFIMTTHSPDQLPQTVLSRVTLAPVLPIEKDVLTKAFDSDKTAASRAYYLSGGNIGFYKALLDGGDEHPYVQAVEMAKQVVNADTYARLRLIESFDSSKDPENALRTLVALERLLSYSFQNKPSSAGQRRLVIVVQAIDALKKHGNRRLVLADLFLHI